LDTDITVVEQDIIDIISLLDLNKGVGPDRISYKMLRGVKYEIAGPLRLSEREHISSGLETCPYYPDIQIW
jgi:hypothetical protein